MRGIGTLRYYHSNLSLILKFQKHSWGRGEQQVEETALSTQTGPQPLHNGHDQVPSTFSAPSPGWAPKVHSPSAPTTAKRGKYP